ncbi:SMP-30/gluconolactonase/LRE family protein [Niabella sp. CC-SYL272]|uniref:SMP-30/gluconolactonase/LRE family protein n=1 Tax=Niabella agricola TaxID=2891571 RepID=UPI001F225BD6|nr:SMP-30/gluconolactonase/LRE family protein [Niabella agricola]MCF3108092.1 SMP-30/gluconolactonase/LRE family protein [Niabella agricola]
MVKVVCKHQSVLGEGPLWDERRQILYWVDIRNGAVHQWNARMSQFKSTNFGGRVGAVALCEDDQLLVAKDDGVVLLNEITGKPQKGQLPEHEILKFRFNDGKCDPLGHFWIGGMSDDEQPGVGCLYTMNDRFVFKEIMHGLTIPNGMAWDIRLHRFYFIDTPTLNIMSYYYDIVSGQITDPRIAFSICPTDGYPDGMAIDTEGMLWIALWDGWKVARYDPGTGKMVCSISLPVARVTSCTFGGAALTDLYITTAKAGLTEEELKKQPLAGSLFVVQDCGAKGLNGYRFKR